MENDSREKIAAGLAVYIVGRNWFGKDQFRKYFTFATAPKRSDQEKIKV
jgi:hypothetical protein